MHVGFWMRGSFVVKRHPDEIRSRLKDAVLRSRAGLPALHDPTELLQEAHDLIEDLEYRNNELKQELSYG